MNRFCMLLGLVASVATASQPAPTRSPVEVLDEMIRHLREVQALVQKEGEAPGDDWPPSLHAATEPLLQSLTELYRAGSRAGDHAPVYALRVSLNGLRSARSPGQAHDAAETLIQTLSFVRSEHLLADRKHAAPAGLATSRTKSREALLEVLARPEFQQSAKPSVFDYFLNRSIVRAMAWLRALFGPGTMERAGKFAYVFLWAAYALAAVGVAWFLYRLWSPTRQLERPEAAAGSVGLSLQSPATHQEEAEAFARAGHHAAALRAYFLMLLATLEQRNLVVRNRTWTNWEYLRAFGQRVADDAARQRLGQLATAFDRVSYGGESCDEPGFAAFRKNVDGFLSSLPGASA